MAQWVSNTTPIQRVGRELVLYNFEGCDFVSLNQGMQDIYKQSSGLTKGYFTNELGHKLGFHMSKSHVNIPDR